MVLVCILARVHVHDGMCWISLLVITTGIMIRHKMLCTVRVAKWLMRQTSDLRLMVARVQTSSGASCCFLVQEDFHSLPSRLPTQWNKNKIVSTKIIQSTIISLWTHRQGENNLNYDNKYICVCVCIFVMA
jgi:hypothetical protein